MTLLLDTHILLWAAERDARLPPEALNLIEDPVNTLAFSVVSIWEVVIKSARGRADFKADPTTLREGLLKNSYAELPIDGRHALAVTNLPGIHRDPFDRVLIAQATVEGYLLLTSDPIIARYPGPIKLV